MKKLLLLLLSLFSLFFIGCDVRQPPQKVDADLIYDKIAEYNETTSNYPYDYEKFQSVLDQSKLQYPNDDLISQGEFATYKAANFYADTDENMNFVTQKESDTYKTRSELREVNEWSTSNVDGNYWVATLRCLKPKVGITSYTWMQVHGTSDSYNYPLLRLLWARSYKGVYDHLWAVIIVSDPNSPFIYEWVDMGQRREGFFDVEVHIKENIMTILLNRNIVTTRNVTYWEDVSNYFKAGTYIDRYGDGGEASTIFSQLHFYDNPDDVVSPHH